MMGPGAGGGTWLNHEPYARTVRTHVRAILRAFDACSHLEALHKARVFGFVDGMTRNAAADRSP